MVLRCEKLSMMHSRFRLRRRPIPKPKDKTGWLPAHLIPGFLAATTAGMAKSDLDRRRDSLQDLLGGSEGRSLLDKMNQGMREVSPQSVRSQVLDKVPEVPTFATAVPSRASCSPFIETHAKDAPVMAPVLEQRSYVRAPKVDNSRVNLMSGLVESETHVCFSRRGLTDADVPSIIKLMDSGKIVDLILAKNEIGDDGAVAIASALLHNKSILHLVRRC